MTNHVVSFIDQAGRYIIGEFVSSNDKHLVIKNPAILVISNNAAGAVQVNTIPIFFKELIDPKVQDSTWNFPAHLCTISKDLKLSDQLIVQYNKAIAPVTPVIQTAVEPRIVKI